MSLQRYKELTNLIKDPTYKTLVSSEYTWYKNIIESLELRGNKVLLCGKLKNFWTCYTKYKNKNPIILVDHNRIAPCAKEGGKYGLNSPKNIFLMGWWGRDHEKRMQNKFKNGELFSIKNNLTAYPWRDDNTFLGFNTEILFPKITKRKYKNYGLIWGKHPRLMKNCGKIRDIIDYLCEKGLKFYTVCPKYWVDLNGVKHLGLLDRREYCQLLKDCKFMIGLGHPDWGLAIIEALYYKTPIIACGRQFPPQYLDKSPNCYEIEISHKVCDKLNTHLPVNTGLNEENMEKLFTLLKNIEFDENDPIRDEECDVESYNKRLDEIFK